MKTTGRPCDSASRCANSSRLSVPSTLTWCAVTGVNSDARREQRREMKDQLDLELGKDALEQRCRSRIEPVISRSTFGASAGSRRVDVERDDRRGPTGSARRSIRPWPISPPAPVMSTTGLRTRELY